MQTPQSGTGFASDDWVESRNSGSGQSSEFNSLSRRRLVWAGLGIATAAAVGRGLWSLVTHDRYHTRVGELGLAELPDGSMAILNTDTGIELQFTRQSRMVRLIRGEALFDVAPDPQRVFIAEAGRFQVEAPANGSGVPRREAARVGWLVDYARDVATPLTPRTSHTLFATRGTTFTLRCTPQDTIELVMLEGSTAVRHGASLTGVSEDTMVRASGAGSPKARSVNTLELEGRVAWLDRRIVFGANVTLREAAEELNRYNEVRISCEGRIGNQQVRGRFYVDRPDEFARVIQRLANAELEVRGNSITLRDPPAARARR